MSPSLPLCRGLTSAPTQRHARGSVACLAAAEASPLQEHSSAPIAQLPGLLQLAGVPVEDRLRRTPAAPARTSASNAASGEDVSGNEGTPAAPPMPKTPPTHSLWMLSRKFVRLLLTTQVGPAYEAR